MKKILENVFKSFNGADEGYSSRKLTAFVIIVCVVATHIKWLTLGNLSQLEMVLTIDYSFIATLFGMTTYSFLKTSKDTSITEPKKTDEPEESKNPI
jgi:hypothetical protein